MLRGLISRRSAPFWAIFLVALFVRLIHHEFMRENNPLYDYLLAGGDNHLYKQWAEEIQNAAYLEPDRVPFSYAPLYPYFLGLVFIRFGNGYTPAIICQHLLGAATVVVIFTIGRRVFDKGTGWTAGMIAALCPTFLLYEGEMLSDWLVLLTAMTAVLSLMQASRRQSTGWWGVSGVVMGLSVLARPNMLLFAPVAAAWAWARGRTRRAGVAAAGVFLMATALAIAPATLTNYLAGNEFVLVSSNGPVNLYIGNAPDAAGVFVQPSSMRAIAAVHASENTEPNWTVELVAALREEPAALPRNLWNKAVLLFRGGEIPHIVSYTLMQEFSPFLDIPLTFDSIAPFALIGIVLALWQRDRRRFGSETMLLASFVGVYALSLILVFILARYRLPLTGALIPFAAYSVTRFVASVRVLVQSWRERNASVRRQWAIPVGIAAGWLCLLVLLRPPDAASLVRWNDHFNLAGAYQSKGDFERAIEHYEAAKRLAPEHATVIDEYIGRAENRL